MCNLCNDTGVKDSGGVTPWGEQIDVPCECSYKWYNVTYYTLSDCKNSVDVLASSAAEAEIIARRKDECFDKLISCAHLPYKDESRRTPRAPDVLARCAKCNALIETTVHCDNCGTFEPTRR